ncbi:MAG: ribosome biogenesis GTPase YlqF [Clostridia bacterium]|nr:ribosome biogenesis GTPase YlqF [Clostridia bacterium]
MPTDRIQWFPGHMAKTRRLIKENLPSVDIVVELLDARIPYSSKNPEIRNLTGSKPVVTVLNKYTLSDPAACAVWRAYYEKNGQTCIFTDCVTGYGLDRLRAAVNEALAEKLKRYEEKGMAGRHVKAMIVGIPNVGKSSLINKLARNKSAKVENRPGVTTAKQWVSTSVGIDLLDMPGVLWPKFDDRTVGENLAMTGAVKDEVFEREAVAYALCERLKRYYPELLCQRYKLEPGFVASAEPYEIFEGVAKKRGLIVKGGEINADRCADLLLDELRLGKIGKITLERPDDA